MIRNPNFEFLEGGEVSYRQTKADINFLYFKISSIEIRSHTVNRKSTKHYKRRTVVFILFKNCFGGSKQKLDCVDIL